jgi:hypothetical protein
MIPELKKANAFNDLCFLYPKHKLLTPKIAENTSKHHSNVSLTKRDKPNTGSNVITKGITKQ